MIKLFEEFNEGISTINNKSEVKVKWYENGQKMYEMWYLKWFNFSGKKHREDGPAVQWWYENGQKMYEQWYLNGKLHREDGHAVQYFYKSGQKKEERFYLNDKVYSKEKWIDKLKEIDSPHYEEQKMLYDAEKYNL